MIVKFSIFSGYSTLAPRALGSKFYETQHHQLCIELDLMLVQVLVELHACLDREDEG